VEPDDGQDGYREEVTTNGGASSLTERAVIAARETTVARKTVNTVATQQGNEPFSLCLAEGL
jgi:hypothetical protein